MEELINPDHNVLFVTLDSCRFDTYQKASTPNLDLIDEVQAAETYANYTLPAHVCFFEGHLPRVMNENEENPYYTQKKHLWRVTTALETRRDIGVLLHAHTLQEGYRKREFQIRGFGGVWYFHDKESLLLKDYQEGEFRCFEDHSYWDSGLKLNPRPKGVLPFSHVDEIAESVSKEHNWFIFINALATHRPYNIGPVDKGLGEMLEYVYQFRGGRQDPTIKFNYENCGRHLHQLQVEALEYIDKQFGLLLEKLPNHKPMIVVVCGDHGESFGEDGRWGHMYNSSSVLTVPLIINEGYVHKK